MFGCGPVASAVRFPRNFDSPSSIAFVDDTAFVTNEDTITLFNSTNGKYEPVPSTTWYHVDTPDQVVTVGQYAWVANLNGGMLTEFGPDSGHFVRTVNPKKSNFQFGGYLVPNNIHLWYLCLTNNSLIELNGISGKVIRRIPLPPITDPGYIALVDNHVWVASETSNALLELNASSGHLTRSLVADYKGGTFSMTVYDGDVWVDGGMVVEELNGDTGAPIRTVRAVDDDLGGGFGISGGGGSIWVLNENRNLLTELDASNGSLVRIVTEKVGRFSNPRDVAYRNGDVWIVNSGSNSVSEIDAANGKLLRYLW